MRLSVRAAVCPVAESMAALPLQMTAMHDEHKRLKARADATERGMCEEAEKAGLAEKERMAAALFGGVGAATAAAPRRAPRKASNASSRQASRSPPPPAPPPAPEPSLLDLGAPDEPPAPAPPPPPVSDLLGDLTAPAPAP